MKISTDDSFTYGKVGIPFITIGNNDIPGLGFSGFHSTADNMDRVDPKNLQLMVQLLKNIVRSYRI